MTWRYIATRLRGDGTEEFLDWDLPIVGAQFTDELSGPGGFTGAISPEVGRLTKGGRPIFEPWSTAIYVEAGGVIRSGAILTDITEEGPLLKLDATGFAGYLQGQTYTGEWVKEDIDPALAVAEMWRYIQSQLGGNLGLKVNTFKTDKLVGNERTITETGSLTSRTTSNTNTSTSVNGKTGQVTVTPRTNSNTNVTDTRKTTVKIKPYELAWWKTFNLGAEFIKLAKETPFDFTVTHRWDGDRIAHEMKFAYPFIKARKDNLRFVVGENIYDVPTLDYDGDQYASHVVVVGVGEGRKAVRGEDRKRPSRLYRSVGMQDSGITTAGQARAEAGRELKARLGEVDISEVLQVDHPHAPIGSVTPGDEIFIQTTDGWTNRLELWCRVLAVTIEPDAGVAKLTVTRAEKAGL